MTMRIPSFAVEADFSDDDLSVLVPNFVGHIDSFDTEIELRRAIDRRLFFHELYTPWASVRIPDRIRAEDIFQNYYYSGGFAGTIIEDLLVLWNPAVFDGIAS